MGGRRHPLLGEDHEARGLRPRTDRELVGGSGHIEPAKRPRLARGPGTRQPPGEPPDRDRGAGPHRAAAADGARLIRAVLGTARRRVRGGVGAGPRDARLGLLIVSSSQGVGGGPAPGRVHARCGGVNASAVFRGAVGEVPEVRLSVGPPLTSTRSRASLESHLHLSIPLCKLLQAIPDGRPLLGHAQTRVVIIPAAPSLAR